MTCIELQESLADAELAITPEQQIHLKMCPECTALVRELNAIVSSAMDLRGADEPSPRVWNSIEIALRREGLIHPPRPRHSLLPSFDAPWGWARWLAPVAATLLIVLGTYVYQHAPSTQIAKNVAQNVAPAATEPAANVMASDASIAGLNDADLLQEAAQQTPAMKAEFEEDLRRVNQYIRDARDVVAANPNDEEAHRTLLEAYQQKSMLFELAMDRSLP
jgi:hypothetical protein